jgi:hypothetical protein
MGLKGTYFRTMEDIKMNTTVKLQKNPKNLATGASSNDRMME